jgi:enolase-phosphatase E1
MVQAVVTDIEGTTSSLSFVKQVLFPYAERVLEQYVKDNLDSGFVASVMDDTAQRSGLARDDTPALIAQLLAWSRQDEKVPPLKELQGVIWQRGYEEGAYKAHLYPDAIARLREWHSLGIPLYVYSSGSVMAQKLFFRFSEAGDLSGLFTGHFDTSIGPKRNADSYRRIATSLGIAPGELLFLSDVVEELDAAKAAGWQTCWIQRPEDGFVEPVASERHPVCSSFMSVELS